jgi:hypothetical protein
MIFFVIQNTLKLASLGAYFYLVFYSDHYKFISNFDDFYIKLILGVAAFITTISVFKQDLFLNKKFALVYNGIVGSVFASLSYKIALLESYKVDFVSLGPWIKLRRLWTPKEYIEMFLELIKDNPKIDPTKISAKFLDQVSKSSSIADLKHFKQILIEQQASLRQQVSQFDTIVNYLFIGLAAAFALYFGYRIISGLNKPSFPHLSPRSPADVAYATEEAHIACSILRDELRVTSYNLDQRVSDLVVHVKTAEANIEQLKKTVDGLETFGVGPRMDSLLNNSNAVSVLTQAFGLEGLESADPDVLHKALNSLRTYYKTSLQIVNEHIAKLKEVK